MTEIIPALSGWDASPLLTPLLYSHILRPVKRVGSRYHFSGHESAGHFNSRLPVLGADATKNTSRKIRVCSLNEALYVSLGFSDCGLTRKSKDIAKTKLLPL